MTFGVSSWLWESELSTNGLEEMAPLVGEMGFDLLEIPIDDPGQMDYQSARRILEEEDLRGSVCAAMAPGRDLIHEDPDVVEDGMAYVRSCVDAAAALGSPHVVGPLYSAVGRCWAQSNEEREEDLRQLERRLRSLSDYAADRDVVLCVETLNRFETSFLNTTDQAIELVDRVDHPHCQIILDLFHLGIEERSMGEAIRSAGDRLRHMHVSENYRGTPGTGQFAWTEIAEALRDLEFDGPLVIETFSEQNETVARAASIWRPLAESPDALARDGLEFLKELFTSSNGR